MTNKHTPGPLYADYNTEQLPFRIVSKTTNGNVGYAYTEADADLFAASPKLLAFAEKVARICNGDEVGNPIMLLQAFGDEARAAIAEAEGC